MFLDSLRAGPSDPGADFWYGPVASPTLSGAVVTNDTALRLSTVYKCVKVYADTLGMLPRRLMRQVSEHKRERVREHPVARLLSTRPNKWQTPMGFVSMMEAHVQMRGTALAELFFDRSLQVEEAVPIHPDRVTTEVMLDGLPRWRIAPPRGRVGDSRVLLPGEVLCVAGLSLDGYTGLSPIEAEREAIGGAIAARDFGSRFWNNDAKPPFWIEIPAKFKDLEAKTNFREEWVAAYGGANRHKPAALDQGMKLHELSVDNESSQWMDARKYSDLDIAGIFRLPPHKIGILSEAKYANIEQQGIEFVTDSMLPRLVCWEEAIQRDLLGYDEELYVKFSIEQLLRGDTKSRYESYSKAIQDGWMTRNEARELEDRNPLPGLDEPLQQLNMGRGNVPALPREDRGNARAQALLAAAAERVARKEVAMVQAIAKGEPAADAFAKHARFVAEVLALPESVAIGYCDATRLQVEALQARGALATVPADRWIETQTAALARLGE
jgi:HK97 family phage portal protein